MKNLLLVIVGCCFLAGAGAGAEELSDPPLSVTSAWVRGLPPGQTTTAVFMTLRNSGPQALTLTGATTPVAESALLHGTMNHDGMLHMTALESLVVPAGGELQLESGGSHLMLMGLQQTLAAGSEVELTLQFAEGTYTVNLPVRSVLDE